MTITAEQAEKLLEGTTPGPWMVGGVRCRIELNDTHSILRYDAEKKRDETIASVWYDPQTGLGRADACLIAAAHDLAAALIASEAARKLAEERLAALIRRAHDAIIRDEKDGAVWAQLLADMAREIDNV